MEHSKNSLRAKYIPFASENKSQSCSTEICEKLDAHLSELNIQSLGTFYPTKNEPNITPIIQKLATKIKIFLPKYNSKLNHYQWAPYTQPLSLGKFNIYEPESEPISNKLCACLVPAVCIDSQFNRLGWGHGFFDHLLSKEIKHRIGIIAESQRCSSPIPSDPWDIKLTTIITEKAIYQE